MVLGLKDKNLLLRYPIKKQSHAEISGEPSGHGTSPQ